MVKKTRKQRKTRKASAAGLSTELETLDIDDRLSLPLDVIGVIAKCLIDDYAFGSCAALNVTCKAVEEETSPILWKTCVLPAAHAFRRLPLSARVRSTSTISEYQARRLENENLARWEIIKNAKNLKYIQYVAFPFLMATINTRGGTQPFKISHGGALSRVKAIISLSERDNAPAQSSPTIFITENYRFGTQDVFDLSRAIHVFQRAGGREVVEAFNRPEGILMAPDSTPASGTTRLPSAPTTSQGPLVTASLPYVPRAIKLYGTQETMARLTSAFVECAQWLRKEDPTCNHGRVLELVQNKEEYLVASAKSFQKAAKADPALTTLPIRFFFGEKPTIQAVIPSHECTARTIIDIFRGTYIQAYPRLLPNTLGSFWMGVMVTASDSFASWEVHGSDTGQLVSRFDYQDVPKILAVDPLPRS